MKEKSVTQAEQIKKLKSELKKRDRIIRDCNERINQLESGLKLQSDLLDKHLGLKETEREQ